MPQPPIGPALRVLRYRRNLRQFEVAEAAGVTKAMLSAFETGKHMPATRSIIAVLDALGADFADLQSALDQMAGRPPKYLEADPEFRATLRAMATSFDFLAFMLRTLAQEDQKPAVSLEGDAIQGAL
jgi:transcriptional regulator with XRE-family HTH domain